MSGIGARGLLNPRAFAANAIGASATRVESLRGPNFFNLDVGLSRTFRIREAHRLQLRFEFFNSTNHVNFNNPGSNINNSNFGTILSAHRIREYYNLIEVHVLK